MIAYLDSSVILRIVLKSPDPLREWPQLEEGLSSALTRVECYRAVEKLWHDRRLSDDAATRKRLELDNVLRRVEPLPLTDDVLRVAAQPLPTHLKTLDALHLATAIVFRRGSGTAPQHLLFATHDKQLARAARELHFDVIGA